MADPKIALREISTLTPDPRNARTHSPAQIEQIISSIMRFGWTNPLLVDDLIRAGHGRLMAAESIYASGGTIYLAPGKANGGAAIPKGTVPVIDCTGWTPDERKAYALADNQLAIQAGWDHELLMEQIGELQSIDFSITDLGFDRDALEEIKKGLPGVKGKTDPDDVPEPPVDPASRLGDVWILGDHRLACGDSTNPAAVDALLDGATPHLMVTDPPYGVDYDPSWRATTKRKDGKSLSTGKVAMGKVENDDRADWTEAWDLFKGDVAYVWHGGLHAAEVQASLEASGFVIRSQIIWNKGRAPISRSDYHWQHEPCWYVVRKGKKGHYVGGRKQKTVWDIANNDGANHDREEVTSHGTQKPVECMLRPIENNSKVGDSIYEPFSGSGTTIIAAQQSRRTCFAMELSPAYVDVAVTRWENFTGEAATLAGDGRTFAKVRAERREPAKPKPKPRATAKK